MKIIIVVGLPGAGKDTAAEFIKNEGIHYFAFSDVIKDEIRSRGMKDTLKNEEDIAKELRKSYGRDIIAQRTSEKIKNLQEDVTCLGGPRNIEELEYMKGFGEVILLVVEADERTRYERVKARGESRDPKTFEEFLWRQNKNYELGIGKVLKTKDFPKYVISNNGTPDELKAQVIKFLKTIK